uniref:Uncharacterized protein n=1 Tax=Oscillatoriales cyanobacterium SpSt-402 TaxID=2282168 RepID=A0A832H403_9CYAN
MSIAETGVTEAEAQQQAIARVEGGDDPDNLVDLFIISTRDDGMVKIHLGGEYVWVTRDFVKKIVPERNGYFAELIRQGRF